MKRKGLIWKIPCITIGVVLGIVLLLLIAVTVVLTTPRARMAVLQKGVELANERMDLDNGFGHDLRLADRGRTLVARDMDRERHVAGCDALDDDLGPVRSGEERDPSSG